LVDRSVSAVLCELLIARRVSYIQYLRVDTLIQAYAVTVVYRATQYRHIDQLSHLPTAQRKTINTDQLNHLHHRRFFLKFI